MSGQPPQGPPAAAGQQQTQQGHQLLKADDVLKLQSLSEDLKQKYRPIFHQLWNTVTTKPAGPENSQARAKLQEFSQKLIAQERVSCLFTSFFVPTSHRVFRQLDLPRPRQSDRRSTEPSIHWRIVAARPDRSAESATQSRAKPVCPGSPATAAP